MSRIRLWIQIIVTAFTNGYFVGVLKGNIFQGPSKTVCVPGLNCYSCPGAIGACPIGALQAVLGSLKYKFSYYVVGILLFFGVVFGRFVCGFLCPFGLVQDLLYKIPIAKCRKRKNLPGHVVWTKLKYLILAVFVIILPMTVKDIIGNGTPWFCKYICPSGTLGAGIPLISSNPNLQMAIGWLFTWKVLILCIILLCSVFIYRPFCKYLCPLGAIYGLCNRISLIKIEVDDSRCIQCRKCQNVCKMDISVWKNPNSSECIRCMDCVSQCPTSALANSFKKKKDKG